MGQFGVYLQHVIMVLESSKEAATNARELSEKLEAAREDPGMIAALLGCGILYKFGLKITTGSL